MSIPQWFMLIGALLLTTGLTASMMKPAPVTSAILYLGVGMFVGPTVLNLFHFNPLKESKLLETLTEVAVLISLFSAGVKMPTPFSLARWRLPVLLATLSMGMTVGLVAVFSHFVLGLPWGAGVLLGAIVAPTDPVLATDVQIRHPGDRDTLRFNLTCEAGMNDGSAFPFVVLGLGLLGLHDIGEFGLRWLVMDVLWATVGGIAIGIAGGILLARVSAKLRAPPRRYALMDDFLGLGLIGLVYGVALSLSTWGFLAVFFAAVALRQTELKLENEKRRREPPVAEPLAAASDTAKEQAGKQPAPDTTVSEGSLVFKEHLERLSELLLVLLVGGSLFVDSWNWLAVALALFLFLVARPLSVMVVMVGSGTTLRLRGLTAWFGVRGIGSLYYLMYAIEHGIAEPLALQLIQITLVVVTLSILLHGTSVKPLMDRFWKRRGR